MDSKVWVSHWLPVRAEADHPSLGQRVRVELGSQRDVGAGSSVVRVRIVALEVRPGVEVSAGHVEAGVVHATEATQHFRHAQTNRYFLQARIVAGFQHSG